MEKRKNNIDYLKALAIIFVVLQHVNAYYVGNAMGSTIFFQYVCNACSIINVPVFVFCAGYLSREKAVKEYYYNRVNRVLVPFLVFAGLKLIYSFFISEKYAHGDSIAEQMFNTYVIGDVYWFCYAILLCCLCAPLLWQIKKNKTIRIIVLFMVVASVVVNHIVIVSDVINVFQIFGFFEIFPFFVFGYIVKEHERFIDTYIERIGRKYWIGLLLIISILGMLIFLFIIHLWILKFLTSMAITLTCKELFRNFSSNVIVQLLSKYSLQIMFLDSFYKAILFVFICRIIPLSIVSVLIVWVLDICLCVITCEIIKKIRYLRKLVGL